MKYLKPYWKATILAPLFMILEVSMDLLQPKLMAEIVNYGVFNNDLEFILKTGGLMILVALFGLLGGVGCTVFASSS